jgi:hypothetical protein
MGVRIWAEMLEVRQVEINDKMVRLGDYLFEGISRR